MSSRGSVDRAPARCSGGHGFLSGPVGTFVPRLCHVDEFTFHKFVTELKIRIVLYSLAKYYSWMQRCKLIKIKLFATNSIRLATKKSHFHIWWPIWPNGWCGYWLSFRSCFGQYLWTCLWSMSKHTKRQVNELFFFHFWFLRPRSCFIKWFKKEQSIKLRIHIMAVDINETLSLLYLSRCRFPLKNTEIKEFFIKEPMFS